MREELGLNKPDAVPIKKDYKVDIEITSAGAYTREGQREIALGLIDKMIALSQQGLVPPEAVKVIVRQFLETFKFGATSEFMDAMEEYGQTGNLEENQINAIKVAVLEVMKDLQGSEMLPDQKTRIEENKVAVAEVLNDVRGAGGETPVEEKKPSQSISFKDLPPEGKVQMAAQAGIEISPQEVVKQEDKQQKGALNATIKGKLQKNSK
jgi:predicted nuclease of restriction endonuclease-like (RecB) superfamily